MVDQLVVAVGNGDRKAEAALALERYEAVQRAADRPHRVDRRVPLQAVAAEHGDDQPHDLGPRRLELLAVASDLHGRVGPRVGVGVLPVGQGDRAQRVAAGAPGRGELEGAASSRAPRAPIRASQVVEPATCAYSDGGRTPGRPRVVRASAAARPSASASAAASAIDGLGVEARTRHQWAAPRDRGVHAGGPARGRWPVTDHEDRRVERAQSAGRPQLLRRSYVAIAASGKRRQKRLVTPGRRTS